MTVWVGIFEGRLLILINREPVHRHLNQQVLSSLPTKLKLVRLANYKFSSQFLPGSLLADLKVLHNCVLDLRSPPRGL